MFRLFFTLLLVCFVSCSHVSAACFSDWEIQYEVSNSFRDAGDKFGFAVAVSGVTMVASAPYIDSPNSVSPDSIVNAGFVEVLVRAGGTGNFEWHQNLYSDSPMAGDNFGESLDIHLSTIVVGSPWDDAYYSDQGTVFVFQEPSLGAGNFVQVAKFENSASTPGAFFGHSVATSGNNLIVVGSPFHGDYAHYRFGAAHIYQDSGGGFTESFMFMPADGSDEDTVGNAVAADDFTVVVAAQNEDDGYVWYVPYSNNYASEIWHDSGSVYVLRESVVGYGDFAQVAKLYGNQGYAEYFGSAVAISGVTVVAGAYFEGFVGAAYIFQETSLGSNDYTETARFDPSVSKLNPMMGGSSFGRHLAVDGQTVLISNTGDDEFGQSSGAVFAFMESAPGARDWKYIDRFVAFNAASQDLFGGSVAIDGDIVVVGSPQSETSSSIADHGSIYIHYGVDCLDQCVSDPCQYNATCSDAHNNYTCDCPVVTSGQSCDVCLCPDGPCQEIINATGFPELGCNCSALNQVGALCDGPSCNNGAVSFVSFCNCTGSGATGAYCETDIDDCVSSPCVNGECTDDGDVRKPHAYNCTCYNAIWSGVDCDNGTCWNGGVLNGSFCDCNGTGYEGIICETEIDECASSPCNSDGGQCSDLFNGYQCTCDKGWEGPHCERDTDDCESSPCMHGVCVDALADYTCDCTDTGYEGAWCESDIDDCMSSPCLNGAVCHDAGANEFLCDCFRTGYEGDICSIRSNECISSPCQNDGVCSILEDTLGFQCSCPAGYEGAVCETESDECLSQPCLNGATCVDDVANATLVTCICADGYEGDFCGDMVDPVDLCESAPCLNGGDCWMSKTNVTNVAILVCDCPDGYEGSVCETESVPQPFPIEITISFDNLAGNATLLDVVGALGPALTASENSMYHDQISITGITVPIGYATDDLGDLYPVVEGSSFEVTIVYANSEQIGPDEMSRRIQESNVPELTTGTSVDARVVQEAEEEENAGAMVQPQDTLALGLVIALLALA